jgi:DNA-binding transcriptional LysR family regulator
VDLNALKLFAAAAEAGSLSAAARRTGVPLPTLSRRVRQLEDDLGLRLLERGPQGLVLTRAGTQLLAEVGPALATLQQAHQRLRDGSGVAGTLRVSIPPHFEPMWSVFAEFGQRYPAVAFDVFVTDRRVDLIADGIDVAIRVGDGGSSSYVGRTLARYRHRVVASPVLVRGAKLERPAELRERPCACWRTSKTPAWTLGGVQVELDPVMMTNDYEHLLRIALDGRVITEVPPFMARGPIEAGRLVEVLPEHPMPLASLRALVLDTRALSPVIRQFLDFVADEIPTALLARL